MNSLIILCGLVAVSYAATTTNSHALAAFYAKGISVWSVGHCYNKNNANCTSFDGLQYVSLDGVLNLAEKSGCHVTITAGTETGHETDILLHTQGFKMHIEDTTCVTNHITSTYKKTGARPDGTALYADARGNVFAQETNHWDITWRHYTT